MIICDALVEVVIRLTPACDPGRDECARRGETLENKILPLLRKQKGFKEELTLSNPGTPYAISISLWENQANADTYNMNDLRLHSSLLGSAWDSNFHQHWQDGGSVANASRNFMSASGTGARWLTSATPSTASGN